MRTAAPFAPTVGVAGGLLPGAAFSRRAGFRSLTGAGERNPAPREMQKKDGSGVSPMPLGFAEVAAGGGQRSEGQGAVTAAGGDKPCRTATRAKAADARELGRVDAGLLGRRAG